jgi:LysM repeat protein
VNKVNYRVQPGDTLNSIAARFGVPVEEIIRANNMQYPYQLFAGQNLFIPTTRPIPRPQPFPPNIERRLERLENRVDRLERQVLELDRRVDRLERRPRT